MVERKRRSVSGKEIRQGTTEDFKLLILETLAGRVMTGRKVREELGVLPGTKDINCFCNAFTELESTEMGVNAVEPKIKLAVDKRTDKLDERFLYYRTEDEETLIQEGVLSESVQAFSTIKKALRIH